MKHILIFSLLFLLFFPVSVSALYHYGQEEIGVDTGIGAEISGNAGAGIPDSREETDIRVGITQERITGNVKTTLNLSTGVGMNGSRQGNVRAQLSNGRFVEIKVLPETASVVAQAKAQAHCTKNNCSLVLKEVGRGVNAKVAYEVHAQKDARVLGLFRSKMNLSVLINAETGELIEVKKPWWAFLASEAKTHTSTNVKAS